LAFVKIWQGQLYIVYVDLSISFMANTFIELNDLMSCYHDTTSLT
jgi:hypothetical protein